MRTLSGRPPDAPGTRPTDWIAPDTGRRLQLILAGLWLLDGVLQLQAVMFGQGFSQMLAGAAKGSPAVVADPVLWSARLVAQHPAVNAAFAVSQLLLGLGIAWRPAVRPALGASIGWAIAVWWLGEGLGGLLTGSASPVGGAPGAALLYALAAVLLWPARADRPERPAPFAAASRIGPAAARLLWLILWAGLAALAIQPAARAPQEPSTLIAGSAAGEPGWLASADTWLSRLASHRGLAIAVALGALLVLIAVAVYLPRPAARTAVIAAIALACLLGLAQGLGGVLTGAGTDPAAGPLLALIALAYWPPARAAPAATRARPARTGPGWPPVSAGPTRTSPGLARTSRGPTGSSPVADESSGIPADPASGA